MKYTDTKQSEVVQAFERYAEFIQSEEYKERERIRNGEPRQLSEMQAEALDLYGRGFNVFPLPSLIEWRASGKTDKHPYGRTGKLFYTRLHNCGIDPCPHKCDDFASLWNITRRGVPNLGVMAGATSGNLLIIDCDSKPAFQAMLSELTRRKIPYWAFTSHKGGACLVRILEGEVKTVYKKQSKLPDVELLGRSHYAVLPPSLHPTGTQYTWYTPTPSASLLDPSATIPPVSIVDLDWLGAELYTSESEALPEVGVPVELRGLSRANQLTWKTGSKDGARNLDAFRVACDLAGNGFSKSRALAIMQEYAARCDPPLEDKELKPRVKSAFSKDRDAARSHFNGADNSVTHKAYNWEAAQAFADSYDWRANFPRRADKARCIFYAFIDRARMSHSRVFRASERELAELANLDRKSVQSYKKRFLSLGWLARPETDKFVTGGASLFLFGEGVHISPSNITCTTTGGNMDAWKMPKTDAEQNVFGAMRGCAWAVYRHLLASPETTKAAIARAVKHPRSSVKAAIDQLVQAGLVNLAEGAFVGVPVTDTGLAEVKTVTTKRNGGMVVRPVKERAKKRRDKHKAEREINASVDMARAMSKYHEKQ